MRALFVALALGALPTVWGCGATPPPAAGDADALVGEFAGLLTGRFDSADQAAQDDSYFHIMLTMCPVEAPALGAHVLYVEQAAASKADKPYRQRLYRLTARGPETVESAIYTLTDPAAFVGACAEPTPRRVEPGAYALKAGCEVQMRRAGEHFEGSTPPESCPSDLRGARYATAEVTVSAEGVLSWDRGYDAEGKQVWGAEKGPYRFVRRP